MKRTQKTPDKTQEYKDYKSKQAKGHVDRSTRRKFDREMKGFGPNDVRWRSNTALAKLAATLPFGYPNGLPWRESIIDLSNNATNAILLGGVLAIRVLLTLGRANDYNAGCNLAFRKSYSFVRHANSGSKNYEAADMGLYYGSYGQALGLLGYLQRIYRLITKFSSTNRTTPIELVKMNSVDYDDIKQHQAELAWLIRWMGNSLNALCVPKMPYFIACYESFKHVYEDNTSPKEQIYMLVPEDFGIYDPTYDSNGGGIKFNGSVPGAGATPLTFSALFTLVHSVMDVLLSDEDIGIISGDILKAYGDSGLFKCEADPDTPIEFEHSPEILQQIHNCTFVPPYLVIVSGYKQNPGSTSTAPYLELDASASATTFSSSTAVGKVSQYIDAFSAEPNAEEIINCCVLKASVRFKKNGSNQFEADVNTLDFDLYLPRGIRIGIGSGSYAYRFDSVPTSITHLGAWPTCTGDMSAMSMGNNIVSQGSIWMTNFDWHPILIVFAGNSAPTVTYSKCQVVGDVQNFNFFDDIVFQRIHDTAMLSLLDFTE